jgi:hypothetical protein
MNTQHPLTRWMLAVACAALAMLTSCANNPPPPDWQLAAHNGLRFFSNAYLVGNSRVAAAEYAAARSGFASTGRADLMARAALVHCATRVASLEFDNCAEFAPFSQDAAAPERAYAAYLGGQWQGLRVEALPAHHRSIVSATTDAQRSAALQDIKDPLARLVAAGVLLQQTRLAPGQIEVAVDTASAQGWRRPLLAWLGVQLKQAQAAGQTSQAASIQRRIDLVLQANAPV